MLLLRLAPLDFRHIGGLHDGLLAVRPAVRPITHLTAHPPDTRVKNYLDHANLRFLRALDLVTNLTIILKQSCIDPV